MGFTVRHEKRRWSVIVDGEIIGAFAHYRGQFWWGTWDGSNALSSQSFPTEITETTQMAEFVFEQYKNIKGSH